MAESLGFQDTTTREDLMPGKFYILYIEYLLTFQPFCLRLAFTSK